MEIHTGFPNAQFKFTIQRSRIMLKIPVFLWACDAWNDKENPQRRCYLRSEENTRSLCLQWSNIAELRWPRGASTSPRTFMRKHGYVSKRMFFHVTTLHLFRLNFLFLSCHNPVWMLRLGLHTKTIWLGLGKESGFVFFACFSRVEMTPGVHKDIQQCDTNCSGL